MLWAFVHRPLLAWASVWAVQHQHTNHIEGDMNMTYSLVDKEFLVFSLFAFDPLLHLDLLQLTALFEHLTFCLYPLLDQTLALIDRYEKLSCILKLSPQLLELLSYLSISTSGLASLSYFATSETYVGVVVVSIGTSLELET